MHSPLLPSRMRVSSISPRPTARTSHQETTRKRCSIQKGHGDAVTSVGLIISSLMEAGGKSETLPDLLSAACARAVRVTGVGMALMTDDGHQGVITATDGPAEVMEDLQFTLGEGPCMDASRSGRPVLQPDLAATAPQRWPGFGPAALDAGIAAIFAFPLQVGGIRLGVLDLYRDRPGHLNGQQLTEALSYSDAALVVLLHLQNRMRPGEGLHPQLADPLDHRAEIHQATGMIAVQASVGLTEALLMLRAHAHASERSTLETARDVVARRLRFGPESDHHG